MIETLESRTLLSSSGLDPNFGTGGEVLTSVGAAPTTVNAVATDTSGRIIVAAQEGTNVAVVRYLPTGALDPQFGTGGKAIVALTDATVHATAMQTDGKILIAGSDGANAFVLRLTTSGKLDMTFAAGGEYFFKLGATNSADGLGLASSGKIYVATTGGSGNNETFVLERINSNGTEDTTFGSGGIAAGQLSSIVTNIRVNALKVAPDGQIVVAGNFDFASSSGPDIVTFTPAGKVYYQFSTNTDDNIGGSYLAALAIQSNGYVIDAGQEGGNGVFLDRFTTAGQFDHSFNGGILYTKFPGALDSGVRNVTVLPNGKIVVVGYLNDNVEVIRYNPNGSLDSTFGTGGEVSTNFGSGTTSHAEAVVYQSSGRIVVAGEVNSGSSSEIGVIRYLGDHVVLTAGQSAVTTGASVAADYRLAGSIVANQTLNFSFGSGTSAVHGQLVEQVVKETTGGTLDFYYQIINASGSAGAIASLVASNFAGYTTYVDYRPDKSGTIAPVTASRSSDQKSVTFNFLAAPSGNGVVSPGKTSFFLYVKTNATHYNALGKVVLNNTASLGGYEPTT